MKPLLQESLSAASDINLVRTAPNMRSISLLATDYDTEGESIGFEAIDVVREENTKSKVYRSVFSSLTTKELSLFLQGF